MDFDFLSTGAVNVESGNTTWFDSTRQSITVDHIMASGALPPGFPAVEIDGQFYWDGGLVSNTPLQYVHDERTDDDLCIFQADLFNVRGQVPASVREIEARTKDIRFSSRTRMNTDLLCDIHATRGAGRRLYETLPELRNDPDARALLSNSCDPNITIAHLIYRQAVFETHSRDYKFSRSSVRDHRQAGMKDVTTTLNHPDWLACHEDPAHVRVFGLTKSLTVQANSSGHSRAHLLVRMM